MKKINALLGAFIFCTLVMSFVHADDWVLFEDGNCKIRFPKAPANQTQTTNTAIGPLQMYIHMYEVPDGTMDDNYLYGLIETEYPDSVINSDKKELLDKFFRNSIDGAVSNVNGKLLTETKIQLDGFPGREFRIDFKDGLAVITMRAYLAGHIMYFLQTITPTKKDHNKSIGRFMDSFAFKL
jgi:hypothetical protein